MDRWRRISTWRQPCSPLGVPAEHRNKRILLNCFMFPEKLRQGAVENTGRRPRWSYFFARVSRGPVCGPCGRIAVC